MKKKKPGTVRIISGKWRGRRLPVPDLPGLRPSGDRSRETLFNWLQAQIRGARCVDLFAGSGVLGLEAASRGAAAVVLVENSRTAAIGIRESISKLQADETELLVEDAFRFLAGCKPQSMDIVFVDPPFGTGMETRVLELLETGDCISEGGLVYVETPRDTLLELPGPHWEVAKETVIGDVRLRLLKKN